MTTERTESEGFYEMVWDCDHCSTKGLLANSQRHCPECGGPQNPDKRYFPSPEQQKTVEGHAYVGADRYCPSCRAPMAAKANNCSQCGSPLDGAKEVRGAEPVPVAAKPRRRIWPWVLLAIGLVVFAIWWLFLRTRESEVTVTAHRWERAIVVEEYGDHRQAAWHDQLPPNAAGTVCHQKQRSTKQIEDGEDCHTERHDKKDGTFEQLKKCKPKYRSVPVNDDWCDFTVRNWVKVDEVNSSGAGMSPAWPTQNVPPVDVAQAVGARRQGSRSEKLILDFGGKTCEVSDPTWRKYTDGQKVKVEERARSGEIVCSSL